MDATTRTLKDVVTDFLASAPNLDEIATYRLPPDLQARAHLLLSKNQEGSLTPAGRPYNSRFEIHLLVALSIIPKSSP